MNLAAVIICFLVSDVVSQEFGTLPQLLGLNVGSQVSNIVSGSCCVIRQLQCPVQYGESGATSHPGYGSANLTANFINFESCICKTESRCVLPYPYRFLPEGAHNITYDVTFVTGVSSVKRYTCTYHWKVLLMCNLRASLNSGMMGLGMTSAIGVRERLLSQLGLGSLGFGEEIEEAVEEMLESAPPTPQRVSERMCQRCVPLKCVLIIVEDLKIASQLRFINSTHDPSQRRFHDCLRLHGIRPPPPDPTTTTTTLSPPLNTSTAKIRDMEISIMTTLSPTTTTTSIPTLTTISKSTTALKKLWLIVTSNNHRMTSPSPIPTSTTPTSPPVTPVTTKTPATPATHLQEKTTTSSPNIVTENVGNLEVITRFLRPDTTVATNVRAAKVPTGEETGTPTLPNEETGIATTIGVITGSVALLLFIVLLWIILRRRRRRKKKEAIEEDIKPEIEKSDTHPLGRPLPTVSSKVPFVNAEFLSVEESSLKDDSDSDKEQDEEEEEERYVRESAMLALKTSATMSTDLPTTEPEINQEENIYVCLDENSICSSGKKCSPILPIHESLCSNSPVVSVLSKEINNAGKPDIVDSHPSHYYNTKEMVSQPTSCNEINYISMTKQSSNTESDVNNSSVAKKENHYDKPTMMNDDQRIYRTLNSTYVDMKLPISDDDNTYLEPLPCQVTEKPPLPCGPLGSKDCNDRKKPSQDSKKEARDIKNVVDPLPFSPDTFQTKSITNKLNHSPTYTLNPSSSDTPSTIHRKPLISPRKADKTNQAKMVDKATPKINDGKLPPDQSHQTTSDVYQIPISRSETQVSKYSVSSNDYLTPIFRQ